MQDKELFELCKQVYEATKWDDTHEHFYQVLIREDSVWQGGAIQVKTTYEADSQKVKKQIAYSRLAPLYTSDYLLEKLPPVIQDPDDKIFKHIQMWVNGDKSTHAGYVEPYAHGDKVTYAQESDKMRKTLLKLTLALHESGELRLERANDE